MDTDKQPPGTPLRAEEVIQGQVLPFLIKILSDFTEYSLIKDCKMEIPEIPLACVCTYACVYMHAY